MCVAPGPINNLKCKGTPLSLSLSWEDSVERELNVGGYRVEVLQLQHKSQWSKELEYVPLSPAFNVEVKDTQALVTQGLGTLIS